VREGKDLLARVGELLLVDNLDGHLAPRQWIESHFNRRHASAIRKTEQYVRRKDTKSPGGDRSREQKEIKHHNAATGTISSIIYKRNNNNNKKYIRKKGEGKRGASYVPMVSRRR